MAAPTSIISDTRAPGELPTTANRPGRLAARPTREYVAGGTLYQYGALIHQALPHAIDAITRDFGSDLYERMLLDPQVASCVHILKMGILSQKAELGPAIADEADERYGKATEVRDFCERALMRLRKLHSQTLYNLLDAMPLGNKVAEIVYELPQTGIDKGKLTLKALKVKPRSATAFLVDPFMNLSGLLAIIPGRYPFLLGGTLVGDPATLPNLLPRRKFLVLSYRMVDEDPRGNSILNPAYEAWWAKRSLWPEYLKYLTQFASPSLIGFTPDGAAEQPELNEDGTEVTDDAGKVVQETPEENMLEALITFRNGTACAFPFGSRVEPLEARNEGDPFLAGLGYFNAEIAKSILCQTLATEQHEHQARAAASVHQDVLGMVIRQGKNWLGECIEDDLLRPLVEYNFGPEAIGAGDLPDLTPSVSFGETEDQDLASMGAAIAALETAGFLAPSQRREIDIMLGLPPRTPEEVELAAQMHAAGAAALDAGQQGEGDGQQEGPASGEGASGAQANGKA